MAEYQLGYTGAKINELFGKIEPLETKVNNQLLFFTNVSVPVNAWYPDSAYAEYPYCATISANGVTSSYYCEVIFRLDYATSGLFAPICESTTNSIKIYATEIPSKAIIIPTIKCTKAT